MNKKIARNSHEITNGRKKQTSKADGTMVDFQLSKTGKVESEYDPNTRA
jgi:hypothetical protein